MDKKSFNEKLSKIEEEIKKYKKELKKEAVIEKSNNLIKEAVENIDYSERLLNKFKKSNTQKLQDLEKISNRLSIAKKAYLEYEVLTKISSKVGSWFKNQFSKIKTWMFMGIIALTIFTFYWIFRFINPITLQLINILNKAYGSYQFAQIFMIGLAIFLLGFLLWEVFWLSNRFEGKKFPWVHTTIVLMVCFFFVGVFYTHIMLGQEDLSLYLRNSTNLAIVGNISCKGSSLVLMAGVNITCDIQPRMNLSKAEVSFTYANGSKSEKIDMINGTFLAKESVEYISFEIEGSNQKQDYKLTVGNPYHFYSLKEYSEMREEFIKYLGIILAIVFTMIPVIMKNFKDLTK
jgi:hypothetical protein